MALLYKPNRCLIVSKENFPEDDSFDNTSHRMMNNEGLTIETENFKKCL